MKMKNIVLLVCLILVFIHTSLIAQPSQSKIVAEVNVTLQSEAAIYGTVDNPQAVNDPSFSVGVWGRSETSNGVGVYGNSLTGIRGDGGLYGAFGQGTLYGVYGNVLNVNEPPANPRAVYANGDIEYTGNMIGPVSDMKFKTIIKDKSNALSKILQIPVHSYHYKVNEYDFLNLSSKKQNGFIAQELEKIYPEIVLSSSRPEIYDKFTNKTSQAIEYKTINYLGMVPILTKAIQELHTDLRQAQDEKSEQEIRILQLEKLVSELSSKIEILNQK